MLKKMSIKKIIVSTTAIILLLVIYLIPSNRKDIDLKNNSIEYNYNNVESTIYLVDSNDYVARTTIPTCKCEGVDLAKDLLEGLVVGGTKNNIIPNGFRSIIPPDVTIKDINLQENILTINFSKELLEVNDKDEDKMIESIIYTLTSIDGIDKVIIKVEGEVLNKLPNSKTNIPTVLDKSYGINKSYDLSNLNDILSYTTYYTSTYNVPDFILGTYYDSSAKTTTRYAITFSEQAKYLMRIINGLGYSFSSTGYLSALPLLAITKSMFDIFSPQQTDTENTPFESTYLYRLIMSKMIGGNGYVMTKDDMIELFKMLLDNTFYINDDFIAMHSMNSTTSQIESITLSNKGQSTLTQSSRDGGDDSQTNFDDSSLLTSDRLKSIFRIGSLIKANTQIAGRLKEFLRSRFGSSVGDNHDSIIVKTFLTDIDVSDIFATASTTGETSSILGEYGGRAIGKGDGLIKFDSNCFGIFMVLCTIIQRRHYFCGVNPDLLHRQKDEFYNPSFDSLGFSISPKAILNGGRNCVIDNTISTSFGFKPRYLEYKFFKPIVAGDFNRPSQRNTLDAFIGSAYPNNTLTPIYSKNINKPAFRAQLYNYNNIFYEHEDIKIVGDDVNSPYYAAISDPFIVHSLLNITMHAPMLSVGDSFETNEDGKDTVQVDKA